MMLMMMRLYRTHRQWLNLSFLLMPKRPCQRYVPCYLFTVSNSCLLFFHVGQPARRHSGVLGLPNIGYRTSPKIWGGFLCGAYRPGNDFELIPTVKMETIHPDVLCSYFVKFGQREIREIVHYLPDKKTTKFRLSPDFIQIGWLSAEL